MSVRRPSDIRHEVSGPRADRAKPRWRPCARAWGMGLVVVVALSVGAGCEAPEPQRTPSARNIVVGSTTSTVSKVAALIYANALRGVPGAVSTALGEVGDRPVNDRSALYTALDAGMVELVPDFTGSLLTYLDPGSRATSAEDVYRDLNAALPEGDRVGDATPASNAPSLYVLDRAPQRDLADCTDFRGRKVGVIASSQHLVTTVRVENDVFGCDFSGEQVYAHSTDLVAALKSKSIAAAVLSPLDLGASADGMRALRDPDQRVRSSTLLPVFRANALTDQQYKAVNRVAGQLSTDDLRAMVAKVDAGQDIYAIVDDWSAQHGT